MRPRDTICLILNPGAGSADQTASLVERAGALPNVTVWQTDGPGAAEELARKALAAGFDVVAAAGGDGTVNQVVNGLAAAPGDVRFAVIPMGTGNDLARSLGVPLDPLAALEAVIERRETIIDLIQIKSAARRRYAANAASGGLAERIDEAITPDMKARFGPAAFLFAGASALNDRGSHRVEIRYEDGTMESLESIHLVAANACTVGGGIRIAPRAELGDGLLDLVILRPGTLLDLAALAARIVTGTLEESAEVAYRKTRSAAIRSEPAMLFNVDGEIFERTPLSFCVVPRALRVTVGPDYPPPAG